MSRILLAVELGEALGAVAALQQERLAGGNLGEPGLQAPRLAGEDQRRIAAQRVLDAAEGVLVGIAGHLPDRQAAPAFWGPCFGHGKISWVGAAPPSVTFVSRPL